MPGVLYLLRCYGEPVVSEELKLLATQGQALQLAAVQQLAARHIQRWCPHGAAPWADPVYWITAGTTPEVRTALGMGPQGQTWAATDSGENMGGEWLNHIIVEMVVPTPPVPLRPCTATSCTRMVGGARYCCAPCAAAWRGAPRRADEPAHSGACDTRAAVRLLTEG